MTNPKKPTMPLENDLIKRLALGIHQATATIVSSPGFIKSLASEIVAQTRATEPTPALPVSEFSEANFLTPPAMLPDSHVVGLTTNPIQSAESLIVVGTKTGRIGSETNTCYANNEAAQYNFVVYKDHPHQPTKNQFLKLPMHVLEELNRQFVALGVEDMMVAYMTVIPVSTQVPEAGNVVPIRPTPEVSAPTPEL